MKNTSIWVMKKMFNTGYMILVIIFKSIETFWKCVCKRVWTSKNKTFFDWIRVKDVFCTAQLNRLDTIICQFSNPKLFCFSNLLFDNETISFSFSFILILISITKHDGQRWSTKVNFIFKFCRLHIKQI